MAAVFDQLLANSLVENINGDFEITIEEFALWQKELCFETLKTGKKIGWEFCQRYDLRDFLLTHVLDNQQALAYIFKTYVK
jgi:hypothetical protein